MIMNNKILYGGGAVVIIAAIVVFMAMRSPVANNENGAPLGNDSTGKSANETVEQKTSLKNLLSIKVAQKCTYSSAVDGLNTSGTVYVANGKMRSDVTSIVTGKTMQNHMLFIDNTSYIWGSGMPSGIKMSITDTANPQRGIVQQPVDINQELSYSCIPWSFDAKTFELPAGVQFTDMSAMMKGAMPNGMKLPVGGDSQSQPSTK